MRQLFKRVETLESVAGTDDFAALSDEELEARLYGMLLNWREKHGLLQGWQWDARFARGKLTSGEMSEALAEIRKCRLE